MAATPRTFQIDQPFMSGDDIRDWQQDVRANFLRWAIDYDLRADGTYGLATRSATASLCRAHGFVAAEQMKDGVTPELRTKIRHHQRTTAEARRFASEEIVDYRRALRDRYNIDVKVAMPVVRVIEASWGFHPPGHDGLDVICPPHAVLHAMCDMVIVRADNSGWWGKAPSGNVALGDGITIGRVLEDVGPFRRGHHIGYGHAEHNRCRVGEKVNAGQPIAQAGLAVAWHIHLMWNKGSFSPKQGRGDGDPRILLDYCRSRA